MLTPTYGNITTAGYIIQGRPSKLILIGISNGAMVATHACKAMKYNVWCVMYGLGFRV